MEYRARNGVGQARPSPFNEGTYRSLTSSPAWASPAMISATMSSSSCGPVTLSSPTFNPLRTTFRCCSKGGKCPMGKLRTAKRASGLTLATLPTRAFSAVTIRPCFLFGAFGAEETIPGSGENSTSEWEDFLPKHPVAITAQRTSPPEKHRIEVVKTARRRRSILN